MNYAPLLEDILHAEIPLTRAMKLDVEEASSSRVRLSAPLAANDNHKGTAFGGSLYSIAVLAGWGLIWVNLQSRKLKAHIVIAKSSEAFLRPASSELESICEWGTESFENAFAAEKPRVALQSVVKSGGIECLRFRGDYALIKSL